MSNHQKLGLSIVSSVPSLKKRGKSFIRCFDQRLQCNEHTWENVLIIQNCFPVSLLQIESELKKNHQQWINCQAITKITKSSFQKSRCSLDLSFVIIYHYFENKFIVLRNMLISYYVIQKIYTWINILLL